LPADGGHSNGWPWFHDFAGAIYRISAD